MSNNGNNWYAWGGGTSNTNNNNDDTSNLNQFHNNNGNPKSAYQQLKSSRHPVPVSISDDASIPSFPARSHFIENTFGMTRRSDLLLSRQNVQQQFHPPAHHSPSYKAQSPFNFREEESFGNLLKSSRSSVASAFASSAYFQHNNNNNHLKSSRTSVMSDDLGSSRHNRSDDRLSISRHGEDRLGSSSGSNRRIAPEENMFFNTNKNSWDCGICRKSFRAKQDLEQHLQSAAHGVVKYTCVECGKGFASVAAVNLHMDQAKHSSGFQSIDTAGTSSITGITTAAAATSASVFMEGLQYTALAGHTYTHHPDVHLLNVHETIVQHQQLLALASSMGLSHYLFFLAVSTRRDPVTMETACYLKITCQVGGPNTTEVPIAEDSYVVSQTHSQSLLIEYEALYQGILLATKLGIHRLELLVRHPLLYSHLTTGQETILFQSLYHKVQGIYRSIRQLSDDLQYVNVRLLREEERAFDSLRALEVLQLYRDNKFPQSIKSYVTSNFRKKKDSPAYTGESGV